MSALKEQDIIPPESWIGTGTPDMPGGEAAMVELLGRNLQLTAVFAYNDNMAAGALTVLKDNGIAIPLHLSIIGFDDIPIARYTGRTTQAVITGAQLVFTAADTGTAQNVTTAGGALALTDNASETLTFQVYPAPD